MTQTWKPDATMEADGQRQLCESLFQQLRSATSVGSGISRDSYGVGETIAIEILERAAKDLGLPVERDAGANLVVTLQGKEAALPFVACGSHLDSIPQGGNYDGGAGVVAGFAVLAGLVAEGITPRRTVKLFGLRGEESAWFGRAYMGSSALFGRLSEEDLAMPHSTSGRPLRSCMEDVGADVGRISRGEPLLDPAKVAAWIELHIEQASVLIARKLPVGIVTGIRGNVRHLCIECIGEAGHSGAVPRWLRHDAVFATADLLMRLDRHWRTMLERGRDVVVTCGIMSTDPSQHAISRIPGAARFSLDIRSQDSRTLKAFYDLLMSEAASIGEDRGVKFNFDRRHTSAPALMDEAWVDRLQSAARHLGLPDETMPSGAGHDAAVFATVGIPTAMIFVRNEHGSHNPDEAMEIDDFMCGLAVMRAAIREVIL